MTGNFYPAIIDYRFRQPCILTVKNMNTQWKRVKSIALLAVLPLVATAAASAHQWISDSNPIAIDLENQVTASVDAQMGSKRIHTVALNRAGAVEGRIASIDRQSSVANGLAELKIYFVRDGKIAQETVTAADGTFVVQGLSEGAYSFVATGDNGFAAYGVRVVANDGSEKLNIMEAAAVSPRLSAVKAILEQQLPAEVSAEILAASSEVSGQQVVGSNRVRLDNGQLKGHVVPVVGKLEIVKGTYVHILKDDEQVAEVQADDTGSFIVSDLEPGVYDFVAAGPSGFAAVSFEAVNEASNEAQAAMPAEAGSVVEMSPADSEEIAVSAPVTPTTVMADPMVYQDAIPADIPFDGGYVNSGYSDSLDVCLTCGQDAGFISDSMDYGYADMGYSQSYPIEYASESVGCGGAAGGSCGSAGNFSGYSSCNTCGGGGGAGGGGGLFGGRGFGGGRLFGGGGGGLGRLLLLGGLAGSIVAIADRPSDPTPISPSS